MIDVLVMDVDGTLTDGTIYMGEFGETVKAFNVKDGYAIANLLPQYGIIPVVITGRNSSIVMARCKELNIVELFQGTKDKPLVVDSIVEKYCDCSYSRIAYIGDDLNDLACMNKIRMNGGIIGCPSDAVHQIITSSNYICKSAGGHGAVREFIDYIIRIIEVDTNEPVL